MKGNCFWVHSLYYFFFINFYEIFLYLSHVPKFLSSKFYLIFVRTTILHILLLLIHYSMQKNAYDCFDPFLEQRAHHFSSSTYMHSARNVLLSVQDQYWSHNVLYQVQVSQVIRIIRILILTSQRKIYHEQGARKLSPSSSCCPIDSVSTTTKWILVPWTPVSRRKSEGEFW